MMSSLPKLGYRISSGTNTSRFSQWLRKEAESMSQITWGCSVSLAKPLKRIVSGSGISTMCQGNCWVLYRQNLTKFS